MISPPVFRFAPSPNGLLHLGHAYSALLNFEMARQCNGRFLVRVEDIDQERCTPHMEMTIYEDLASLALSWEKPVMRQSERFDIYRQALDTLRKTGLLYPAFLSRSAIKGHARENPAWPRDPDGTPLYPGKERDWSFIRQNEAIKTGQAFSWRLDMKKALQGCFVEGAGCWGDVILGRKDVPASYHLCVVLDDAAQKVSHVVRGQDLEASTSVHRLLQKLLGLPHPVYHHHPLVLDERGRKLSKSEASTALRTFYDAGLGVEDIKKRLCWDAVSEHIPRFLDNFDLHRPSVAKIDR